MLEPGSISQRLRELRERAGLSVDEVAAKMNVSPFPVEIPDEEFTCEYSPADARRFCEVLKADPGELFGVSTTEPPVSASELVQLAGAECCRRKVTLEQFEEVVGWRLSQCINPPERLVVRGDEPRRLAMAVPRAWHSLALGYLEFMKPGYSHPVAGKAGVALRLAIEGHCPGRPEPGRPTPEPILSSF